LRPISSDDGGAVCAGEEGADIAESFFSDRLAPYFRDQLLPRLRGLQEDAKADFTPEVRGVQRVTEQARSLRNTITLASLEAAVGMGLLISRSVGRPLATLTRATAELAEGRLTTRVDVRSRDEAGSLARAFNEMASSLQSKTAAKGYVDNILRSMHET
jgi:nitrogen fixation/metabolism regulation signal transduction histidine kinase